MAWSAAFCQMAVATIQTNAVIAMGMALTLMPSHRRHLKSSSSSKFSCRVVLAGPQKPAFSMSIAYRLLPSLKIVEVRGEWEGDWFRYGGGRSRSLAGGEGQSIFREYDEALSAIVDIAAARFKRANAASDYAVEARRALAYAMKVKAKA